MPPNGASGCAATGLNGTCCRTTSGRRCPRRSTTSCAAPSARRPSRGGSGSTSSMRAATSPRRSARRADPRTFALVLTQSAPEPMVEALERAGFSPDDYRVMTVPPAEMPRYLHAADVGLSLIRTSYARRASSPTKFAEYLAAGLPVISTADIGDLDAHIEEHRAGVLLHSLDGAAFAEAVRAMDEL